MGGGCTVEAELDCARNGCPSELRCALDNVCRTRCSGAPPCPGVQRCFAEACYDVPPLDSCASGMEYRSTFSFPRATDGHLDSAVLADLDADGDLDFVAHMNAGDSDEAWAVFSNDGAGTFLREASWLPIGWGNGQELLHLLRADVDGDTWDDLVATHDASVWQLSFLRNVNKHVPDVPMFEPVSSVPKRSGQPGYCSGDLDGNGRQDFVFADPADELVVYELRVEQAQAVPRNDLAGLWGLDIPGFQFCAVADLEWDGDADVVVGAGKARVLVQHDGAFSETTSQTYVIGSWDVERPELPRAIDFNGDGLFDLAVGGQVSLATNAYDLGANGQVVGYASQDTFALLEATCSGAPHLVVVPASQSGLGRVLWNDGTGELTPYELLGGPDVGRAEFAVRGDVDRDGYDDFIGLVLDADSDAYVAVVHRQLGRAP